MSDEIHFDGQRFISAHDAADAANLTRDYVARLCREGRIVGRRLGKSWYVHEESLKRFIVEQSYEKSVRNQRLSEERSRSYASQHPSHTASELSGITQASPAPISVPSFKKEFSVAAPITHSLARHALAAQAKLREAAMRQGESAMRFAPSIAAAPGGIQEAFARAAHGTIHVPVHAITPLADFMQKFVAMLVAFTMTFGTYALVDPSYARFALASMRDSVGAAIDTYERVTGGTYALSETLRESALYATENPKDALVAASGATISFIPDSLRSLARSVNNGVDSFLYAIAFPGSLTNSVARTPNDASVTIQVAPYTRVAQTSQLVTAATSSPIAQQAANPVSVIERERIVERVVAQAGGITDEYLNQRLTALRNELYGQVSVSSGGGGGYTTVNNNYSLIAQSQKIDQLASVDISDSTFTDGTISGSTLTDIPSLSVSGSASVSGVLSVQSQSGQSDDPFVVKNASGTTIFSVANDGSIVSSIASSTSSYSALLITGNATATSLYTQSIVVASTSQLGNATSTTLFSTVARFTTGVIENLTATLAEITGLTVQNSTTTNATTTNLFATNASTTNATSTTLFSSVARFTTGVVSDLTATLASITGLTVQNSTTTNATTTNLFATNASTTNATSTNLAIGSLPSVLLSTRADGSVRGTTIDPSLTFSANQLSLNTGNANSWTALQNFLAASSTQLSAGRAYFGSSATSTFGTDGALTLATPLLQGSGGTGFASYAAGDILYADNLGVLTRLAAGSNGQVLKLQAGLPAWGVDVSGGGGGGGDGLWATSTDSTIHPVDTAYTVLVGTNSTSTLNSILEVSGQQYISTKLGIATTSPVTALSVGGNAYLTGGLGVGVYNTAAGTLQTSGGATIGGVLNISGAITSTATGVNILPYASSTRLSVFGTSYFGGSATSTFSSAGVLNLAGLASAVLGVDASGNVVATSTIGSNLISGALGTVNGTTFNRGDSITITAASSTLLANNNTWSGTNIFSSGLLSLASTTIGGGTQATGLTISGGATTTGNAYFAGNVGIGISNPTNGKLQITGGNAPAQLSVTTSDWQSGSAGSILSLASGAGTGNTYFQLSSQTNGGGAWGDLVFQSGGGKVGIGSTTPWAKLAVQAQGGQTNPVFEVASSSAGTVYLSVSGTGNGTTTVTGLNINGSATSTSNVGFNITGGCISVNGECTNIFRQTGSNIFAGSNALSALTGLGHNNFAVGVNALSENRGGDDNIAIGEDALLNNDSSDNNVASGNIALGRDTLKANIDGGGNIALGLAALTANTGGAYNLGIGSNALGSVTSGSRNVAIGAEALSDVAGSYNVALGESAGSNLTAGDNNIFIGYNTSAASTTGSNQLNIGNILYGNTSTGVFGIGSTTPWAKLAVTATAGQTNPVFEVASSSGSTFLSVSGTGFGTTTVSGLSINGSATSTSNVGFNITNGCYAVNGTCLNNVSLSGVNTWTALQSFASGASTTRLSVFGTSYFGGSATSTFSSAGVLNLAGLASAVLGVDASGNVVATSTIGSNLISGALGTVNGTTFNRGDSITITAASSTLLANNNTWSGLQTFSAGASSTQISVSDKLYLEGSSDTPLSGAQLKSAGGWWGIRQDSSSRFNIDFNNNGTPAALFTIDQIGNTGIGTSTAYAALSVWGNSQASNLLEVSNYASTTALRVSATGFATTTVTGLNINGSATSTSNVGFNITSGCYAVNGTCVGGGGASLTGTTGQTAYFSGTNTAVGTSTLFIDTASRVGIGTSTPYAKLTVWGSGTGTGTLFEAVDSASTTVARLLDNGTGYFLGNIGIGTTSPMSKLSVQNTAAAAQFTLAYSDSQSASFQVDSAGDLIINPSGDDVRLTSDNLFVCNGACQTGTTGTGNLIAENKIGIGTSTPSAKLTIETGNESDASTNLLRIASTTNQNIFLVDANGNVGIGTSTPSQQLSISKLLYVGGGNPGGMGTATSTFQGDVLITGKLDVSTIDPVYTIDGVKYATYGHSTIGVKEELAMLVEVSEKSESGAYEYAIPFSKLPLGSDPWLFWQVTTFGEDWKDLVVSLTPGFDGKVHYEKDVASKTLRIISSAPGEVSLRLIADRYDADTWPNLRPDQGTGFEGHIIQGKK